MKSRHLSIRISEKSYEQLEALALSKGESVSECARRLIEEGRRMAEHPGIVFRDSLGGRIAALADGPAVWRVINIFPEWDDSWDIKSPELLEVTSVNAHQVMLAQRYRHSFPEEIDQIVRENREMSEKAYAEWLQSQSAPVS
jgi:hypothetical protein